LESGRSGSPAATSSTISARLGAGSRVDETDQHVDDEVDEHEEDARHHDHAHHGVEVLLQDGADAVGGHARPGEDELDHEGVADQRREFEAEDGEWRDEARPEHVFEDAHEFGHAKGTACLDVVLARHVDHRGAGDAGDLAERGGGKRDRRQEQVAERLQEDVDAPADERVDGQEAGHISREGQVLRQPSRGRQDVEDVAGEDLQEERQEEARRDRREDGDQADEVVGPSVLPARGDDAERDAEQEGDGDGRQHQLESRREGVADIVVDGRSVSSDRPRSPRERPAMKRPYCSMSGRFSPSFSRKPSTCSWLARGRAPAAPDRRESRARS